MAMQHTYFGEYDMKVELALFTLEEGGRKMDLPFQSDFDGPRIYLDGNECHAVFTLQDREWLHPGETAHVFVTFGFPQNLIGKLHPDQPFLLHEGYRPIGKGRILSLLHFEKHAEEALQQEKERTLQLPDPKRLRIPPRWEQPGHRPRKKKNKEK
jgi:hypothetical protein